MRTSVCSVFDPTAYLLLRMYVTRLNFCILHQILFDMIWYSCQLQLGCHPVAAVHIYTQTIHRTIKQYIEQHNNWKSADRAPSWLVIPWHLPYKRGKSREKPQSVAAY